MAFENSTKWDFLFLCFMAILIFLRQVVVYGLPVLGLGLLLYWVIT